MNSYKQINENWQKFIKEQEQEPKVDKPFDSDHAEMLAAVNASPGNEIISALDPKVRDFITNQIEYYAHKKAEEFVKANNIEELVWFKKELLTQRPETWFIFKNKDEQYMPIRAEDFSTAGGGYLEYGWNDHPMDAVPAEDYGMGSVFAYQLVTHAEKLLGRSIDVQLAVATVPEVADDLEDQGVTDLSQIDIEDLDLEEPPEPEPEPLPAPMPPSDSEPAAPKAAPAPEPEPEPKPEPEAPASPDDDEGEITLPEPEMAIAGINSEVYDDSLINMLKNSGLAKALSREQISQLLSFMLQATEQDDIVLEAIGDPERAPRTYSPETTRQLNDLINSFNLSSEVNQKLEKLIKKWAKLNTVKFSPPAPKPEPTPEPSPGEEEDTSDEPTETGPPRSTEDEESGIVDKAIAIGKQKAQDLGVEIPDVDQVKLALDAISFAGVTGAGELVATPATLASLALNIGTRDWDDALIDVVSLLPVAGKAFRLSAKTAKTAKAAKTLATAADISSRAGKIADVVKKGKAAGNVAKNLGMVLGSRLDKKELQQVAKIKDFIAKLSDSEVFGDAPDKLSEPFIDMMQAANKAQQQKNKMTESLERLQILAGIKKRKL